MRILIRGAGAIGGYDGARLAQAGADVTFAVRAARRSALKRDGLLVRSPLGDFARQVRAIDADRIDARYDAVILACKGYDLAQAMDDIAPAMGLDSVLLPFLNGLGAYHQLDRRFGRARVLGGVAYIAVQIDQQGAITQLGGADTVLLGARDRLAAEPARELFALFDAASGARAGVRHRTSAVG